jgi:hypothetical protein
MSLGRRRVLSLLLILAACQEARYPTTLTFSSSVMSFDAVGDTKQLTGVVKDQNDREMPDEVVAFSSDNGAVASVSATGMVTSVGNGSAVITGSVGSVTATVNVTVTQVPKFVTATAGSGQSGPVAATLPNPLTARVEDRLNAPVRGATVNFVVSVNGGTVSPAAPVTDSTGVATAMWTFGNFAGAYTVQATPAQGTGSAQFTGTANPAPADTIFEVSGGDQSAQAGTTLPNPLVVKVTDQYGNRNLGVAVTFTVTSGSGTIMPGPAPASVDSTDSLGEASVTWTLGPELGPQTVQAAATGLKGSPVTFVAVATGAQPASVEVYEGDNEVGLVGKPVNYPPAVLVRDGGGSPFPNATVDFAVQSGGGSATLLTAVTDADGIARVGSWTLGASAGANTMTATVSGAGIAGNPVTFTVEGRNAAFDIELRYLNTPSAPHQAAFDLAEQFWERAIFGDLDPYQLNWTGSCAGVPLPNVNETVDDVIIYVSLDSIDGPFNKLGGATPCDIRDVGYLTDLGVMIFDTTDLTYFNNLGLLDEIVKHEMGHVLGIGTLWHILPSQADPFLKNPSRPNNAGADTHFAGPLTIGRFDAIGGESYGGAKVPVENTAVAGSADSHWRESVFNHELLTPELDQGSNPISTITLSSLVDLGYLVTYSAAEAYVLPGAVPVAGLAGTGLIDFGSDVLIGRIRVSDRNGRLVRWIEPVRE